MKWPWNRDADPSRLLGKLEIDAKVRAAQELEARVQALEDRHAHLVADAGLLRIEWSEVLDKISHWASRQSGRDGKKAKQALENLAQDAPGATIGEGPISQYPPNSKAALRALVRARRGNGG